MPPSDTPPETRNRILREALAAWRNQGLITAEQHGLLLAHSESSTEAPAATPAATEERVRAQERKLGRGVTILINLGAIILAAGLIVEGVYNPQDGSFLVVISPERYLAGPVQLGQMRKDRPAAGGADSTRVRRLDAKPAGRGHHRRSGARTVLPARGPGHRHRRDGRDASAPPGWVSLPYAPAPPAMSRDRIRP